MPVPFSPRTRRQGLKTTPVRVSPSSLARIPSPSSPARGFTGSAVRHKRMPAQDEI
jgi:hypothetical protein